MMFFRNQRGSVTEFAVLVPAVLITAFTVLQLLIINAQRSEGYAIADRISFLAAAVSMQTAAVEASAMKAQHSYIESIQIHRITNNMKVTLTAAANLLLPLPPIKYQVVATSILEP